MNSPPTVYTFAATFNGPGYGSPADIQLPLSQPISFNTIWCTGDAGNSCDISWIGAH